jgi:hypothetical protein
MLKGIKASYARKAISRSRERNGLEEKAAMR